MVTKVADGRYSQCYSNVAFSSTSASATILFSALLCKASLFLAEDNTFHISAFSDLHCSEHESTFGMAANMNSEALRRQSLSQEQPNFVVLNGDLITGENTLALNSTGYLDVAPTVEANV